MITKLQAKQLREVGVMRQSIPEMDPEIIDVVIDLNQNGLPTLDSCAGHPGNPTGERGLIFFGRTNGWAEPTPITKGEYKKSIVILRKHGLKNIKTDKPPYGVSFDPIGTPWKSRKKRK